MDIGIEQYPYQYLDLTLGQQRIYYM